MPWNDYWYGDVWLVRIYHEKWRLDVEERNREQHRLGYYFNDALNANFHNYMRGLTIAKHAQAQQYSAEPLKVLPPTPEEKEQEAERERKKAIDYFTRLQKRWEKQQAGETEIIKRPMNR